MSDCAGFLQGFVRALFIDRLKTARGDANAHELLQLRHPNTLTSQVRRENARHHLRDMPAYPTFLFGQTAPVNHAASHGSGSCDITDFHVAKSRLTCRLWALRSSRSLANGSEGYGATAERAELSVERAITHSGQS